MTHFFCFFCSSFNSYTACRRRNGVLYGIVIVKRWSNSRISLLGCDGCKRYRSRGPKLFLVLVLILAMYHTQKATNIKRNNQYQPITVGWSVCYQFKLVNLDLINFHYTQYLLKCRNRSIIEQQFKYFS